MTDSDDAEILLSDTLIVAQPWHAEDCPLYELAEHDCAYNLLECTCGMPT